MEKTQFHLVVQKVDVLRSPYVVVTGVVESGSISVNDRVRIQNAEDRSPKPEVERIEVWPELEITTAKPGRQVRLLLRGVRKKRMIHPGDVLERVEKKKLLFRGSKTAEVVAVCLGFIIVLNLLYTGICLLMGWNDEPQVMLRQSLAIAGVYIPLFLAVDGWEILSKRFWRKKHQQDDWETDFQILKCTPAAYQLVILPIVITVLVSVFFYLWAVNEPQTFHKNWENGTLNEEILLLTGLDLFCLGNFLRYSRQKVFYSRYLFRLVSIGRREDISWTGFRSISLVRAKKKSRLILTTEGRSITLRSDILSYRWGDFVDFVRQIAVEYHIHFEDQQEKK